MEIPAAGRRADLAVDFPALVETAAVTVALADVGTDAMAVDLETAAVLGMTQVQVSRREKKILLHLRELLL